MSTMKHSESLQGCHLDSHWYVVCTWEIISRPGRPITSSPEYRREVLKLCKATTLSEGRVPLFANHDVRVVPCVHALMQSTWPSCEYCKAMMSVADKIVYLQVILLLPLLLLEAAGLQLLLHLLAGGE